MTDHDKMVAGIAGQSAVTEACRTVALRVELEQAQRHIETLTGFYMDNVLWTRAAEEARAFLRGAPTCGKGLVEQITDAQASFGYVAAAGLPCTRSDCVLSVRASSTTFIGWTPAYDRAGNLVNGPDPNWTYSTLSCAACGKTFEKRTKEGKQTIWREESQHTYSGVSG